MIFLNSKNKAGSIASLIAGLLPILLGGAVIFGWHINNILFVQVNPAFAPMQYNTALCFLFAGLALVFMTSGKPLVSRLLGGAIALIGAATLGQYVLNLDFGIDQFFMDQAIMTESSYPGRMAPNTALCFFLIGTAFVFGYRRPVLMIALAMAVCVLSAIALLGYLLDEESIYGWGNLIRMTIHTAVGFVVVSGGMICLKCFGSDSEKLDLWKIAPVSMATIVVAITLFSSYSIMESTKAQNDEYFSTLVFDTQDALKHRFERYEQSLWGGLGLFYASKSVERGEWKAYVKALDVERHLPGINGVGYIDYVLAENLESYLQDVKADDAPNFLNYPDTPYPDKFIIKFIEPVDKNREAVGLDIGFESNRREAAERARDLGVSALTKKIELVQDNKKQAGFLLLIPVYDVKETPVTLKERRAHFQGWVYAPFIGANFLQDLSHVNKNQLDFEVYDGETITEESLIFSTDHSLFLPANTGSYMKETGLDIAGRRWTIIWRFTEHFNPAASYNTSIVVIVFGSLFAVFIYFAVHSLLRRQAIIAKQVEERTAELNESQKRFELAVEGTNDGIWDWPDINEDIVYWSPQFKKLLGYEDDEIEASFKAFLSRLHEDDLARVEMEVQEHFERNVPFDTEYRLRVKSGEYRWFHAKGVSVKDESGNPLRMLGSLSDITERKKSEEAFIKATQEIQNSQMRLEAVLKTAVDGIITINEEGTIHTFNPAAEKLFGYEEHEVVGKNVKTLMPENYSKEHDSYLQNYISTGEAQVIGIGREVEAMRRDGKIFSMELGVSEVFISGERVFVGIVRDITERKEAESKIQQYTTELEVQALAINEAKEQAEMATEMKSEFLANISHEIRTPMNGIIGMANLLMDTKLDKKQSHYLSTVINSADNLLQLINDILDFSKIEAGKIEFERIPFDFLALVKEIVALMEVKAREKDIDLKYNFPKDSLRYVIGDPGRVRQILLNLISNAMKFTYEGQIVVSVKGGVNNSGKAAFNIEVKDTGIGIPEDRLDYIFEKFNQADSSTTRKFGGTGLGLAICQYLTEMMGGEIGVRSTEGVGSVFHFSLLLDVDEQGAEREQNTTIASNVKAKFQNTHILLVEDSFVNQDVATTMLESYDCLVTPAGNGEEAVKLVEQQKFDIIFMDCLMPVMDGYEATQAIRQIEEETGQERTPIIACTAHAIQSASDKCFEVGMDDFVSKPIHKHALIEALLKWLPEEKRVQQSDNQSGEGPQDNAPADISNDYIDHKVFEDLQNMMGEKLSSLVEKFLKGGAEYIRQAEEGVSNSNAKAVAEAAHPLKSSSAALGAIVVSNLSKSIEERAMTMANDGGDVEELADDLKELKRCFEETESFFLKVVVNA